MSQNKKIKIAFIDDGVNPAFIPENVIFENYIADEFGVYKDEPVTNISHGTLCYQVFINYIKTEYHLISIKVINSETFRGNHKSMVSALKWCKNQNIDLVNMSVGTRQFSDFAHIGEVIDDLVDTIIVAACNNDNDVTFPACMPNVIGVRHVDFDILNGNFAYLNNPFDGVNVLTCVKDIPISYGSHGVFFTSRTNSLATPVITAKIFNYMVDGLYGLESIKNRLKEESIRDSAFFSYDFYKNILRNWIDITVPIIFISNSNCFEIDMLRELLKIFSDNGYRAIALSNKIETSITDSLFFLQPFEKKPLSDVIELYYNFSKSDILFIHHDDTAIPSLSEKLQPDFFLSFNDTPQVLYEEIVKSFP